MRGLPSAVRQKVFLDVVAVGLEQHIGAAQLTDLLLGPLDHAVALTGLGINHFSGPSHFEALFSARLGLNLGHLALLWPQAKALGGLKMLENELIVREHVTPPRQPLNQPGDERARLWQRAPIMARNATKAAKKAESLIFRGC